MMRSILPPRWMLGAAAIGSIGCGAEQPASDAPPSAQSCAEHEIALPDGSCIRPGIAPDGCGAGFVHDGEYACHPVLPSEPCPHGLMAVPGDAACRPVMPCGAGRWGDIPLDGSAVYVDAQNTGEANGTADAPWTTIGEAVTAAAPGALVAIAAGSYVEDVQIWNRPVRLWGVCPESVEVVGTGAELGPLMIGDGADGSEVHGLSLRGTPNGLAISGSENVVLDRLWVHDTEARGIDIGPSLGATSVTIVGSLVENAHDLGINVSGARATIESTAVRGTRALGGAATGINIQLSCNSTGCDKTAPVVATVRGALVEGNEEDGVTVMGAEVVVESTVVRDTLPAAATQEGGRGARIQSACTSGVCDASAPANVTLRTSVFERNHFAGISVAGASATLDAVVVRQTWPRPSDLQAGYGIYARLTCTDSGCDPAARSTLGMRASAIFDNHDHGILVVASDATVESTVVRGTLPRPADKWTGRGVVFQDCGGYLGCTGARSMGTLLTSLVEHNHEIGVAVLGSDAVIEATAMRDTLPGAFDQKYGQGLGIGLSCPDTGCDPNSRSSAQVRNARIETSHSSGIAVRSSDATIDNTWVLETRTRPDGLYGDGVTAIGDDAPASIRATAMRIEDSARAGLSTFGASVSLADSAVVCAAFSLNGETNVGREFDLQDLGGNSCGCPTPDGPCKLTSGGLAPPDPLGATE